MSKSSTICFLASYLSSPWYFPPNSFIIPWSSITLICGRLCLLPTSKSFGSCAGVILTAPVPNSISTYSSPTTGISLSVSGNFNVLPIKCLNLSSFGLTATAVSPNNVSGLVVAISKNPEPSDNG